MSSYDIENLHGVLEMRLRSHHHRISFYLYLAESQGNHKAFAMGFSLLFLYLFSAEGRTYMKKDDL